MRAFLVVITIALAGCASAAKPAPAAAGSAAGASPPPSATAAPTAESAASEPGPSESPAADVVDLTRGVQLDAHGARIMLRGTGTKHPSKTVTLHRAELEVSKGDEASRVTLEREQPGNVKFVEVLGLQIALESVDALTKPSTARILVRP